MVIRVSPRPFSYQAIWLDAPITMKFLPQSNTAKKQNYTAVEMGTGVFTAGQNSGSHSEQRIAVLSCGYFPIIL